METRSPIGPRNALRFSVWRSLCGAVVLALIGAAGTAQEAPATIVAQQWTVDDGLPVNNLTDIVQTPDGYLWIATWDGLVRFDGARFTTFNVGNTPGLPSNRILDLFVAPDGDLWILSNHPLAFSHYAGGRFETIEPVHNDIPTIDILYVEADGTIWSHNTEGEVLRYARGTREGVRTSRVGAGPAVISEPSNTTVGPRYVTALYRNARGELEAQAHNGRYRWRDGVWAAIPEGGSPSATPEHATPWALGGTKPRWRLRPDYEEQPSVRYDGVPVFKVPGDVAGSTVDHEGNFWVATRTNGLIRLKPSPLTSIPAAESPWAINVYSVLQARDGAFWFGGWDRNHRDRSLLTRLDADGYTTYTLGERGSLIAQGNVLWLDEDDDGAIWAGTYRFDPQQPSAGTTLTGPQACARADIGVYQDQSGSYWLPLPVSAGAGVCRYTDGQWAYFGTEHGFPRRRVSLMRTTRDGAVWFLTSSPRLIRYEPGADGRAGRFSFRDIDQGRRHAPALRGFYEDADGVLWLGSYGTGLTRLDPRPTAAATGDPLRDAHLTHYRTPHGLFDDIVHAIIEDDYGRLWMSSNRGVFWILREELNAFARGEINRVHATSYDEGDGMKNREANGGYQRPALRASDGRLYFPTQEGVVVVDPDQVNTTTVPSPLLVESVTSDETTVPVAAEAVALGAAQRNFEIAYTALSFRAPERLRFRYRLVGLDEAWVAAGTRRTAYYTNVPSGDYRFEVEAFRGGDTAPPVRTSLAVSVAPFFYETRLFAALSALAVVLLLVLGFRIRSRELRRRHDELERLVAARTEALRAEKRRTETQAQELVRLDEAKNRFFANITHEFRTPLTLILGPLKEIRAGTYGPVNASIRHQLALMLRNSQRLLRLINQILDLARIEAGHVELRKAPHDLGALVARTAQGFAPLAERAGIRLNADVHCDACIAEIDAEAVEKVLLNLLSNALKFTPHGGRVDVTLDVSGDTTLLTVADTGIGIAADRLARIFDRFYQADASATRSHEGTGIGLALAKELVELHGGTIEAESTPGVGSTFRVHLPCLPATAPPARPIDTTPLPAETTGDGAASDAPVHDDEEEDRTTVLVVDDNADVRAFVRSILSPAYRVLEAADGEAGLEGVREALPDLIVADVMMPRMDGFALSRALREDPLTESIPVLLLTALATVADEVEGLETGADDYITKPFEADVLRARVAALLASRRRLRERYQAEGASGDGRPPDDADEPTAVSPIVARLRTLVETEGAAPGFGAAALAEAAALSYKQLHRKLRDETGETPSQFIRRVRVERAARLLEQGAGTVSEVAYAVGFNSLSYFNRAFRETHGVAPSAYVRLPE